MSESLDVALTFAVAKTRQHYDVSLYEIGYEQDVELGILAGKQSRFPRDPNIPREAYECLYSTWIANCLNGSQADVVFVVRSKLGDTDHVVGMLAAKIEHKSGHIILLAVSPEHRRQGLGKLLIASAYNWVSTKGISLVFVTTQEENTSAVTLYKSCGGLKHRTSFDFHFWLRGLQFADPASSEIPNAKPFTCKNDISNVLRVMKSGMSHTHWHYGPECEKFLETELGAAKCLLTTSGTSALELSALCIGCQPGMEIIMPSYTFVSTALAFVTHGAVPVFVDIRADTQNIDETKIEAAITSKTTAIVCVHYAGVACEMDTIMSIAKRYGLYVIEDNAHGIFGTYKGRPLGTIGDLGCLSFHYTKNFTCGEGGALLLKNKTMLSQALISWEKGTNRCDFLEGKVSKYYWVDRGGSFVLSELNAAVLYSQLSSREFILKERLRIWHFYHAKLEHLENSKKLKRPVIPMHCEHNAHIYYIRVYDTRDSSRLAASAKKSKIGLFTHYEPLHASTGATKFARAHQDCPETDLCALTLFRLPIWVGMSEAELERVVKIIYLTLGDRST